MFNFILYHNKLLSKSERLLFSKLFSSAYFFQQTVQSRYGDAPFQLPLHHLFMIQFSAPPGAHFPVLHWHSSCWSGFRFAKFNRPAGFLTPQLSKTTKVVKKPTSPFSAVKSTHFRFSVIFYLNLLLTVRSDASTQNLPPDSSSATPKTPDSTFSAVR